MYIVIKALIAAIPVAIGMAFANEQLKAIDNLVGIPLIVFFSLFLILIMILSILAARSPDQPWGETTIGTVKWFFIFNLIGVGIWFIIAFIFSIKNLDQLYVDSTRAEGLLDLFKFGVIVAFSGAASAGITELVKKTKRKWPAKSGGLR